LASGTPVQFNGTVPALTAPASYAADALFGLLAPFWHLVLGTVMIVFLVAAGARLARRGRSRMNTALLVTGAGIVGLVLLGMLLARAASAAPAGPVSPAGSISPASR
jgi:hypothetical protein